ncbi:hypothetical protein [Peribacillus simplex]|uniref:hypothetical protein n=1 Tax=Peribacillus simplex TaxID=1478 RepID=UPI00333CE765
MQVLHTGVYDINGIAWTGKGHIANVDISIDGGQTWHKCKLTSSSEKYSWVRWNYKWEALKKGKYTIISKATDSRVMYNR